MTQPIYVPHFPIKAGCRPFPRPSRLHDLHRHALDAVCALFGTIVLWLWLVVVLLGAK